MKIKYLHLSLAIIISCLSIVICFGQQGLIELEVRELHRRANAMQNVNPDSTETLLLLAQNKIKKTKNPRVRDGLWATNQVEYGVLLKRQKPKEALDMVAKVLPILKNQKDWASLSLAYGVFSTTAADSGNYNRSLHWNVKAVGMAKKSHDDTLISSVYYNQALIYSKLGQSNNAFRAIKNSVVHGEKAKSSFILGAAYSAWAMFCEQHENWEKATALYERAKESVEGKLEPARFCILLNRYGNALLKADSLKRSIEILEEAHAIALISNSLSELFLNNILLSEAYIQNNQLDHATKFLKESKAFVHNTKHSAKIIDLKLAGIYVRKNDQKLALTALDRFVKNTAKTKFHKDNIYALREVASLYEKIGKYKKAYYILNRWGFFKDSLLQIEKETQLQEVESRYTLEKAKNTEIQQANLALAASNKRQTWLSLAFLAFLLLGGGLLWFFRTRALKERERNKELQLKQVLNAQETERKRVARELHDGIGQALAALKLQLQRPSAQDTAGAIHNLDNLCRDVRNLSHRMMPMVLLENGIDEAIDALVHHSFSKTDIEVELAVNGVAGRLPQEVEIHLYRITQELINNVLKHSKASQVGIVLTQKEGRLVLSMEDNGKGIAASGKGKGIGLANIKSRLETLSGHMELDSTPGQGVHVRIVIPIVQEARITA